MTTEQSHSGRPCIGWLCTYTPEEIILAAGFESRRVHGRNGNISQADNYLHPNLCAYVRACLAALLENNPVEPAGIIAVDSCDAMRRLFDACKSFLTAPFLHILTLPHARTREAVSFYCSELKSLAAALRGAFGVKLGEEELFDAIIVLNETRSLLNRLDGLRGNSSLLSAGEYYRTLLQAMTQPKHEFNSRWRDRLQEHEPDHPQAEDRVRLILSGGVLDDPWIIDAIEEAGGHVVGDDLCCGSRYFENSVEPEGDLFLRIAERYIQRPPCARMSAVESRTQHILELVERTEAEGVIYYAIKFCDSHLLDWVTINRELQKRGIPSLRCEADYSIGNREQIRTRLQAFLEMLR